MEFIAYLSILGGVLHCKGKLIGNGGFADLGIANSIEMIAIAFMGYPCPVVETAVIQTPEARECSIEQLPMAMSSR
jgi:hypothetical protein